MLSKFYIVPAMPLKVAWPHWPVGQAPLWWRVASNVTMAAVGLTAKFYMGLKGFLSAFEQFVISAIQY